MVSYLIFGHLLYLHFQRLRDTVSGHQLLPFLQETRMELIISTF